MTWMRMLRDQERRVSRASSLHMRATCDSGTAKYTERRQKTAFLLRNTAYYRVYL